MSEQIGNNKRIAKNTMMLYFRMFISMAVGLYTSRVVLATLGISDYGLYNVIGGFVSMLTFINGSMANGTQRFLSYTIGENNSEKLKIVFSNALNLHLFISFIVFVIAEIIGPWFLANKMTIPEGREYAAQIVFQFSVLTLMVSILQVPFMACLIAREKMNVYAYMSIYEVVMKLAIAILIQVSDYDKLILYAVLVALVQISSVIIYICYCRNKYSECRFNKHIDISIIRKMSSFSLWSLIGMFGFSANGQGVNILLNLFYGTAINAARGVAFHVNAIIVGFSKNFQMASNPQIIKLYAEKKIDEMTTLAIRTSKFSAYLLILVMMPFLINIEYVLKIWLGKYPDLSPIFLRIILVQSLVQSMSNSVVIVTFAGGKIKMPNITTGFVILCFLLITYISLKNGASPIAALVINIFPWLFECYFNTYYAEKYTGFSQKRFYIEVYGLVFPVFLIALLLSWYVSSLITVGGIWGFVIKSLCCVVIAVTTIGGIGMKKEERTKVFVFIHNKIIPTNR